MDQMILNWHDSFKVFEHPHPDENAIPADELDPLDPVRHVYSRYTQDVSTRAELVLSKIHKLDNVRVVYSQIPLRFIQFFSQDKHAYAITYASGIAATYAVSVTKMRTVKQVLVYDYSLKALVHLHPKRIAITGGYHGVHSSIQLYQKSRESKVQIIDLDEDYQEGDLCWVETPVNPTGESR